MSAGLEMCRSWRTKIVLVRMYFINESLLNYYVFGGGLCNWLI
jgi:hypothetical protein